MKELVAYNPIKSFELADSALCFMVRVMQREKFATIAKNVSVTPVTREIPYSTNMENTAKISRLGSASQEK